VTESTPQPGLALFGQDRLGLGCMALTGLFGPVAPATAIATLHRALDEGVRHFDTAELYGPYANETLVAGALSTRRETVSIATKVGYRLIEGRMAGLDGRPEALRRAVEGSLRRLGRERLDLLYLHRVDPAVPIEESVGALEGLRLEGKVHALGLSAVDRPTLDRARAVADISAVQNEQSLLQRTNGPDTVLAPGSSTTFVAYSPLARGLLAGPVLAGPARDMRDYRRSDPRLAPDRLEALYHSILPLTEIAAASEVEPAVIALAWLLLRAPQAAMVVGCRTPEQVTSMIRAGTLRLAAEEVVRLDGIAGL